MAIVATLSTLLFILWLFYRDRTLRPMTSGALWVVLAWIWLIGSRHVSSWAGADLELESEPAVFIEGSPLDRNTFFLLILSAAFILWRRRIDWREIVRRNPWFFVFFVYCGVSVVWSDFAFVSLKRWVKEAGNIMMVLVILTEKDPVAGARAVFSRYAYLAITVSILLVTCFPDIGWYERNGPWEGAACGGVTTEKNQLGLLTFTCGLFLVWDWLQTRKERRKGALVDGGIRLLLLLMDAWLIYLARSSSAVVCLVVGIAVIFLVKLPAVKSQLRYLGTYFVAAALPIAVLFSIPGFLDSLTGILGRDRTLTGRTEIWADLLGERINPLVGSGFQSFWLGDRLEYYFDKYVFHLSQAHNGYLETYLNGGVLGTLLLIALLVMTGAKLKKEVWLNVTGFPVLLFGIFIAALTYNLSEAMFSKLNLLWFMVTLAALYRSNPSTPPAAVPVPAGAAPAARRRSEPTW